MLILKILLIGFLFFLLAPSCKNQHIEHDQQVPIQDTTSEEILNYRYDLAFLTGKFIPEKHPDFVNIPKDYADKADMYLHREAFEAFLNMHQTAKKEGIELKIRSATRNHERQKNIWENKWNGVAALSDGTKASDIADPVKRALKILEYSSMPGTSRHHWGTDIDLNSFDNEWFERGEGLKTFEWLNNHAAGFGFCRPYTALGSDRENGYFEEKWHWSYFPLSNELTTQAEKELRNNMISGFQGAETAEKIDVVSNYVLGISPACVSK
jgi:zinc D-Ala-D-Ala carboxypeptidase